MLKPSHFFSEKRMSENKSFSLNEMAFYKKVAEDFEKFFKPHVPDWFWDPEFTTWKYGRCHYSHHPVIEGETCFGKMEWLYVGWEECEDRFTLYVEGSQEGVRGDPCRTILKAWRHSLVSDQQREMEEWMSKQQKLDLLKRSLKIK